MHQHNILAIDTAMAACSVAVYNKETDAYTSEVIRMKYGQAERLVPLCQEILAEAKIAYTDLDVIIATSGPGAFTGVRVGLSTARGLALALNIPLWGITTLQAMAHQHTMTEIVSDPFSVLIDTRRHDFYAQDFDAKAHPLSVPYVTEELVKNPAFIEDTLAPSTLITAFFDQQKKKYFVENPQPLYVRDADVSYSKKKQRVLEG